MDFYTDTSAYKNNALSRAHKELGMPADLSNEMRLAIVSKAIDDLKKEQKEDKVPSLRAEFGRGFAIEKLQQRQEKLERILAKNEL